MQVTLNTFQIFAKVIRHDIQYMSQSLNRWHQILLINVVISDAEIMVSYIPSKIFIE